MADTKHDQGLDIQGTVVRPSDESYEKAIARTSAASVLPAAYVVYPSTAEDIPIAIRFALSQNPPLEIAVKGGGCHTSTVSSTDGGLVIDLAHLKSVKVSEDKKSVAVGGGALWGDVYAEVEKHDVIVVGGNVWFVGIGGYMTGGGHSYLSGHYGMAVDNLLAATVVLADGRIVKCSKDEESDLFWAISGGGGQFGIVTEFVLKAYPAHGPALVGAIGYPGSELGNVLKETRAFLKTQPINAKVMLLFSRAPPHFQPSVIILPYIEGSDNADKVLAPFRTNITPVFDQTGLAPSMHAVSHAADSFMQNAPPRSVTGGAMFTELWDGMAEKVFEEWTAYTENDDRKDCAVILEFGHKDKIAELDVGATAFPVRNPHYYMIITGRHSLPESDAISRAWISKTTAYVRDFDAQKTGVKMAYSTNLGVSSEHQSVEDIYGENLARLRKVKAKYDPKTVWSRGWVIEPDFEA